MIKKNKYHNIKFNGYDSIKEAKRAEELKLLQRAGKIKNLEEQKVFELIPAFKDLSGKTERAVKYKTDFFYYDNDIKRFVINDVKSPMTKKLKDYIIKRKLTKRLYPEYKFLET